MFKRKLSDDVSLQELKRMEESGMSRQEIASAVGSDVATIRRYLGPSREVRVRRMTDADIQTMHDLDGKGFSIAEIARRLNTTPQTVRKHIRTEPLKEKPPVVEEYVPTFMERVEQEIREGKRQPPAGTPKFKRRLVTLEGDLGIYQIDITDRSVKLTTILNGETATADDLRRFIRELQAVEREMGAEII